MLKLTEHTRFMQGFQIEARVCAPGLPFAAAQRKAAAYKNLSEELLAVDLAVPRTFAGAAWVTCEQAVHAEAVSLRCFACRGG